jgi:2,4-dienoyl-CoA reductase-like NADH-dependent reductase (Old Yellow Enzyme family)
LIEPYNVVIDERTDLEVLERWAATARSGGAHAWLQLNYPGRQALRAVTRRSVAHLDLGPGAVARHRPVLEAGARMAGACRLTSS